MDDTVVALWERAAATYETEVPYFTLMGERVVAHAALAPGEEVLDVACGKGAALLPAAVAVGAAGHVIGIDIVPAMVDAARTAARAAGLDNVEVAVMDGEELEFEPAGFDVVIGNPPYIRQESLRDDKPFYQDHYEVYQGTADLFVYFFGIRNPQMLLAVLVVLRPVDRGHFEHPACRRLRCENAPSLGLAILQNRADHRTGK